MTHQIETNPACEPERSQTADIWEPDGHQVSMVEDPDCRTVACAVILQSPYDASAAQDAFNALLARHCMLRSHYRRAPDGRLLVITPPALSVPMAEVDLVSLPLPECYDTVLRIADSFNLPSEVLYAGPLVGCTAIRISKDLTILLLGAHHSIVDAASVNIVRHDLRELYRAALLHTSASLDPIAVEYRDFIRERSRWLYSDAVNPHLNYWRGVLAESRPLFFLPRDRKTPPTHNFARPNVIGRISYHTLDRLRDLARAERVTIPTVLAAVLSVVLANWSGQAEVAAWISHLGRMRKEHFRIVGCFLDHWLLRLRLPHGTRFIDAIHQVHRRTVEAMPHLRVTLHRLIPDLHRLNEVHPAIVANFMPYAKYSGGSMSSEVSVPPRFVRGLSENSRLGLIIDFFEFADHMTWHITHNSHLFDDATVTRFSEALHSAARLAVQDPYLAIADLVPAPVLQPDPPRTE